MSSKKEVLANVWTIHGFHTIGFVAVKTHDGFKAYMGCMPGVSESVDIFNIAETGSKMSESQARGFFPELKDIPYDI